MVPVTTLLAAAADQVLKDAFDRFVPVALIAIAFGVVYWLYRRGAARRESEKRREWLDERREKRGAPPRKPPPDAS